MHVVSGRLTPDERALRAMTERELQQLIVGRAKVLGWQWWHISPGQVRAGKWITASGSVGFPDLVLLRPPSMLMLELKRELGQMRPGQQEAIDALDKIDGVIARVVRPSDVPAVIDLLL